MEKMAKIQFIQRAVACDGPDTIYLERSGPEGSYLTMGKDGKLSLLAGGEDPGSDDACEFWF